MSANVKTGKTRSVRYCGRDYMVEPGEVHGQKQAWTVSCGDEQLTKFTLTRSKAVNVIHAHAVDFGGFPAELSDGLSYDRLVSALCR